MKGPCYVEIVAYDGGKIVKRMGPMSEHKADKVDGGANRNLDHTSYYTRIVESTKRMQT